MALAAKHQLATRETIAWSEVCNETFVVSQDDPGPEVHDDIISRLAGPSFHPNIKFHGVGRENLMHIVARGFGISITTESTLGATYSGGVFRPIGTEGELLPSSAIWPESSAIRR